MTAIRPVSLFWLVVRMSLGVVLFVVTGLVTAISLRLFGEASGVWDYLEAGLLAAFFGLQMWLVWRILLFRRMRPSVTVGIFDILGGTDINPGLADGPMVPTAPRRPRPTLSAAARFPSA